jgi:hypothetical protein
MQMTHLGKGMYYRLWDVERGPYGLLVITVLSVFVISPLVVMGALDPLMVDIFFAVFMFAGVLTVHPRPAARYLVLLLAILAVLTRFASKIVPHTEVMIGEALIEAAAVGVFAALVSKQFLLSGRVASHRIGAAIVVYLLLGILWSRLYQIAGLMIPGAFHMADGSATLTSYLYFSFVTLATIGYGDISPVHPVVRHLAILEAIIGQMYIAVLIARLVSTSDSKD